jgi:hypothetical protein
MNLGLSRPGHGDNARELRSTTPFPRQGSNNTRVANLTDYLGVPLSRLEVPWITL